MEPWITSFCHATSSTCAPELFEELAALPACPPFGPVHHAAVGAVLLTAYRNAAGKNDVWLDDALTELQSRAGSVPGGTCARWGICGAAVSAGSAWSIINGNAPTNTSGWSECQLLVANIAQAIAQSGNARCCKRDSRIAVSLGAQGISKSFGVDIAATHHATAPICTISSSNSVCAGTRCPYHQA